MNRGVVLFAAAVVVAAALADRLTGLSVTYFGDLNWTTTVSSGVDHVVGSDSILQEAPFTPNVPFSAHCGLAVFCSFGAVPMLGTVALVAIVIATGLRPPLGRVGLITVLALLGIVAVFAVPMAGGYDPIAVARRVAWLRSISQT